MHTTPHQLKKVKKHIDSQITRKSFELAPEVFIHNLCVDNIFTISKFVNMPRDRKEFYMKIYFKYKILNYNDIEMTLFNTTYQKKYELYADIDDYINEKCNEYIKHILD